MSFKPLRILIGLFFIAAVAGSYFLGQKTAKPKTYNNQSKYTAFLDEIYTTVQTNYWEKMTDEQLINLFMAAARKFGNSPQLVTAKDKQELFRLIQKSLDQLNSEDDKIETTTIIADAVLQNLQPPGRSRLYTQQLTQDLSNTVNNVDPTTDHYQTLRVDQSASQTEINQAYQEKLSTASSSTEKQKISIAFNTLKDTSTRQIYNQTGADPTMPHRRISDAIYYIGITKFSPTTLQELSNIAEQTEQYPGLNTLILDLQNNIGGVIDGLPYFLGPFIGADQYAYQFLHQEEKKDFKTKSSWLNGFYKFKKVIVLINGQAQSSAEVMASVLKKYHVGVLVGTPTKGWGTVEKVLNLENQLTDNQIFSVFLVHSLTLREDNLPIEGNGVIPDINITDPAWQQQLNTYYNDPQLTQAVSSLILP